ncbi:hypothetical protein IQ06DRAFT_368338 [Phaeosphaeriaceae sp. SRC1lsM3a]|nr:hypothetical protein IQ06DRAFT_368338 [Stagonospora sp. SRC1lsM3a]
MYLPFDYHQDDAKHDYPELETIISTVYTATEMWTLPTKWKTVTEPPTTTTVFKPTTHYSGHTGTPNITVTKYATNCPSSTADPTVKAPHKAITRVPTNIERTLKSFTGVLGEVLNSWPIWNPSLSTIGVYRTVYVLFIVLAIIAICAATIMGILAYNSWRRTRAWYVDRVQSHMNQSRKERDDAIAARNEALNSVGKFKQEEDMKAKEACTRLNRLLQAVKDVHNNNITAEELDHRNWYDSIKERLNEKLGDAQKKIQALKMENDLHKKTVEDLRKPNVDSQSIFNEYFRSLWDLRMQQKEKFGSEVQSW